MRPKKSKEVIEVSCSFCQSRLSQVKLMIQGRGEVFICDQCVDICLDIVAEKSGSVKV